MHVIECGRRTIDIEPLPLTRLRQRRRTVAIAIATCRVIIDGREDDRSVCRSLSVQGTADQEIVPLPELEGGSRDDRDGRSSSDRQIVGQVDRDSIKVERS